MFVKHTKANRSALSTLAYKNLGVNYFILMGLSISKQVYSDIYYLYHHQVDSKNLEAVLFKRYSGNLQLMVFKDACSQDVIEDFKQIIQHLAFKTLITSQNYVKALKAEGLFGTKLNGAYIHGTQSVSLSNQGLTSQEDIRPLRAEDVGTIENLYKLVFDSYTPPKIMETKLSTGRGRGFGLFHNNQLISVAQTDFEIESGAIIVGVATHPDYQHAGYGYRVMSKLCQTLMLEGKEMFLHFDSPIAGKLYDKMGFIQIDQIGHYSK
jgi:predicted GNAT family acetyltransferase